MVCAQHIAEKGQAYRNFRDSADRNTNGSSHNPLFSAAYNYATRVSWDPDYDQAAMSALARSNRSVHKNQESGEGSDNRLTSQNHKDEEKQKASKLFQELGSQLQIGAATVKRATRLFGTYRQEKNRVTSIKGVHAACMVGALREALVDSDIQSEVQKKTTKLNKKAPIIRNFKSSVVHKQDWWKYARNTARRTKLLKIQMMLWLTSYDSTQHKLSSTSSTSTSTSTTSSSVASGPPVVVHVGATSEDQTFVKEIALAYGVVPMQHVPAIGTATQCGIPPTLRDRIVGDLTFLQKTWTSTSTADHWGKHPDNSFQWLNSLTKDNDALSKLPMLWWWDPYVLSLAPHIDYSATVPQGHLSVQELEKLRESFSYMNKITMTVGDLTTMISQVDDQGTKFVLESLVQNETLLQSFSPLLYAGEALIISTSYFLSFLEHGRSFLERLHSIEWQSSVQSSTSTLSSTSSSSSSSSSSSATTTTTTTSALSSSSTKSSAMSTSLRAVAVYQHIRNDLEKGWTTYTAKLEKAPEEIRTMHNAIQQNWIDQPTEFQTTLKKNWNAWEKTILSDIRVMKHSCGNVFEKLLRDWAILPDQTTVRQIFRSVGLDEHVLFSTQNPRKTTLKCFKFRTTSKVPGRRPSKKRPRSSESEKSGKSGKSGKNGSGSGNLFCKPPSDKLLVMIQEAAQKFQKLCPTKSEQNALVQHSRWGCFNDALLSLKIPLLQYQKYAISTGIVMQIEQETFRNEKSESSEHMHRRHTTAGMRRHTFLRNDGNGGEKTVKRQRLE